MVGKELLGGQVKMVMFECGVRRWVMLSGCGRVADMAASKLAPKSVFPPRAVRLANGGVSNDTRPTRARIVWMRIRDILHFLMSCNVTHRSLLYIPSEF